MIQPIVSSDPVSVDVESRYGRTVYATTSQIVPDILSFIVAGNVFDFGRQAVGEIGPHYGIVVSIAAIHCQFQIFAVREILELIDIAVVDIVDILSTTDSKILACRGDMERVDRPCGRRA